MTVEAWRICKPKYVRTAFDGAGAARAPGRWNTSGQKVVYTSDSQSLATLELLVHTDERLLTLYVLIPCSFDESFVEKLDPLTLPRGWQRLVDPGWAKLQQIGGDWITSHRSAVLRVPSGVVPGQCNYLLNPEHPDFSKIVIGTPLKYKLDPRLGK